MDRLRVRNIKVLTAPQIRGFPPPYKPYQATDYTLTLPCLLNPRGAFELLRSQPMFREKIL